MEKKSNRYSGIGGQAVLEGVMMKNKEQYAIAVRKPDGKIETKVEDCKQRNQKLKNLPFIRGVFNFVDSLVLGTKCLTYSASFYDEEEMTKNETKFDKFILKVFGEKAEDIVMGITVCFSIIIAIGLFMILPYWLSSLLSRVVVNDSLLALFEAIIRILIFITYVVLISFMKDIQRVYQYHGAEHKCINCVERGRILNVENVIKSSRLHKRCGTSFLLFVVVISAVLFFFIRVDSHVMRVVVRLLLIPIIAGISYEIIRLSGRYDNWLTNLLSWPGMMLQKLTTKEPDEQMVEVAIASVEAVFDWKAYFKENFQFNVDEYKENTEVPDADETSEADLKINNEQEDGDSK